MLKRLLPKTLLLRSLLIVIAPIFLIQLVISIVFFDSIWFKAHKSLARLTAGEINTFLVLYPEFEKKK
jgi:two-component system osmolarity sensor histidine kinase EnvZ